MSISTRSNGTGIRLPAVPPGGRASGFVLSGILWDPVQPIAIINGETVRVGERLGTYEVLDIGHEHVTLSDGTQSFDLDIAQ